MKKIFLFIVFATFAMSCENKVDSGLVIEQQSFKAKANTGCQDLECTSISINVPIIHSPQNIANTAINAVTLDTIADLMSFEADLTHITSYDSLVKDFIKTYEQFIVQFPDDTIPWKAEVEVQNTFTNATIYATAVEYYTFAGGAHGYNSKFSLIFDFTTGELIPTKKLFKNWGNLMTLIEPKLSYAQELKDKHGVLALPSNVYIFPDKVLLAYTNEDLFSTKEKVDYIEFSIEQISPFITYDLTPTSQE